MKSVMQEGQITSEHIAQNTGCEEENGSPCNICSFFVSLSLRFFEICRYEFVKYYHHQGFFLDLKLKDCTFCLSSDFSHDSRDTLSNFIFFSFLLIQTFFKYCQIMQNNFSSSFYLLKSLFVNNKFFSIAF